MRKTRTPDWLRLARAAVAARDGLRAASLDLVRVGERVPDPEVRRDLAGVLEAIVRETDRLRFALKARVRRGAGGRYA